MEQVGHPLCCLAQSQEGFKALHCQQRQLLPWAFAFAAPCTTGKGTPAPTLRRRLKALFPSAQAALGFLYPQAGASAMQAKSKICRHVRARLSMDNACAGANLPANSLHSDSHFSVWVYDTYNNPRLSISQKPMKSTHPGIACVTH